MLSICFPNKGEWWISGKIFQRLFESGVSRGHIPVDLRDWREIADANGGYDFSLDETEAGERLLAALRMTARDDLSELEVSAANAADRDYRAALQEFMTIATSAMDGG